MAAPGSVNTEAAVAAAQAELEAVKRDWELDRLASARRDEARRAEARVEARSELLTFSAEDAANQVGRRNGVSRGQKGKGVQAAKMGRERRREKLAGRRERLREIRRAQVGGRDEECEVVEKTGEVDRMERRRRMLERRKIVGERIEESESKGEKNKVVKGEKRRVGRPCKDRGRIRNDDDDVKEEKEDDGGESNEPGRYVRLHRTEEEDSSCEERLSSSKDGRNCELGSRNGRGGQRSPRKYQMRKRKRTKGSEGESDESYVCSEGEGSSESEDVETRVTRLRRGVASRDTNGVGGNEEDDDLCSDRQTRRVIRHSLPNSYTVVEIATRQVAGSKREVIVKRGLRDRSPRGVESPSKAKLLSPSLSPKVDSLQREGESELPLSARLRVSR